MTKLPIDRSLVHAWVERSFVLASLILTRPKWAWNCLWFSPYNPVNLRNHLKQLRSYDLYKKTLAEIVQRACRVGSEQANNVLDEFKKIKPSQEAEDSTIPASYDATENLAKICYSTVRLTAPATVVETGVGRGVTSYYILKALEKNGKGHLYSFDIPPLKHGALQDVGQLVPASLRSRWSLRFGPGINEMKKLRRKLGEINIFIHDSNHTYLNQLAEYKIALPWLTKNSGILISDDVGNDALIEAAKQHNCEIMVTTKKPNDYIGILLKTLNPPTYLTKTI